MTRETMRRSTRIEQEPDEKNGSGVLVYGPGENTRHMLGALEALDATGHDVHYAGVSTAEPAFSIKPGRLHEVDTSEGQEELQRLVAQQAFNALYISVPDTLHAPLLKRHLADVAEGRIRKLVTTKPMVTTREELRAVEAAMRQAEERLRERLGDNFDPEEDRVFVHEHYLTKGAWRALRKQLGEVSNRLGRLRKATVDIQEARTAEDEGRAAVVSGGAFKDLGPHAMSLGLDAQAAINENRAGRYLITDSSRMDVTFVRYEGSEFPAGVETGFLIDGVTKVIDKTTADTHELAFRWSGGKGLIDKKEVTLEFEDPETGVCTTVTADLLANKLYIPESLADLFPETEFDDNGYGASVTAGLNGGDPNDSFQSFQQAKTVTIWGINLTDKGRAKGQPTVYPRGMSIQEIERSYGLVSVAL